MATSVYSGKGRRPLELLSAVGTRGGVVVEAGKDCDCGRVVIVCARVLEVLAVGESL